MKTILIGILLWLIVAATAGCKTVGDTLGFTNLMEPRVENGRVLTTEEASQASARLWYGSGMGNMSELNEREFWGEDVVGKRCKIVNPPVFARNPAASHRVPTFQRVSRDSLISGNTWRVENTSGAYNPLYGGGYYRYQGKLYRIPPRNTAEYDWYLKRKAWGDFK